MTERFIYFIRPIGIVGPIKIGISARPEGRMLEMLEWSPFDLEIAHRIPGTYTLEKRIQQSLANDHLRHEWFSPSPRVVKLVADLQAGVTIDHAIDLNRDEGLIRTPRRSRQAGRPRGMKLNASMTDGQLECLRFVMDFEAARGRVPTYQEIADGLGLHSKSGVHRYITALEERGRIIREPNIRCGYSVVTPSLRRAA